MSTQEHLSALKRSLAQLHSARGELTSVQGLGETAVGELDALNGAETLDTDQLAIVESRVRGLHTKKSNLTESISRFESELATAVEQAFAGLDSAAQSGPEIDEATKAVLPWCNGIEAARKAALQLPTFVERTRYIGWMNLRRDKGDADEMAPILIKFFESMTAPAAA